MALAAQKTGRASRSFAQLWQVPTFLLGLTAFALVAATAPLRQDPTGPAFAADVAFIRNALTKNACDTGVQALAESLVARAGKFPDRLGETHFLAGSVHQQLADAAADVQQIELRHKAFIHLERAHSLGVPPADAGILSFSLGRLLFETNGDLRRAAELLARSLESNSVPRVLGYALLTKVHLKTKNLDGALAANQKHLDAIEKKHELEQALLLRGELWLEKGNRIETLKSLDRIGPKAAEGIRLRARLLQAKCCEGESLWPRAVALWRELLNFPDKAGGRGRVLYSLGWSLANNASADAGEASKTWLECAELGGAEGQAALLRLGELSLRLPEPDAAAAIDYFTKALLTAPSAADYQNPLVDLAAARAIFDNTCRVLEQAKDHVHLQELAQVYKRLALPGVAEEWLARGLEGHAHTLKEREAAASGAEAQVARAEAQTTYQKAGETFEHAARARTAGPRSELLWRSATCYRAAGDIVHAVIALERFVQEETSEDRLAEGWLTLAEAYAAVGKKADARSAYYKCIEFPATPFAFRARYHLAIQEAAEKNVDQAVEILKQNITTAGPGVDREAHEKSLLKLGEILFEHKDYDKACIYLKEAAERYPHHASGFITRDKLGDCYRKLASASAERWKERPKETHHKLARDGWLDKACAEYDKLADILSTKAADEALASDEAQLLLRARIVGAKIQLERGELTDALRRTHDAFQKYPARHIGRFAAYQEMDKCWEQIRRTENRELIERARNLLLTSTELLIMDVARMQDTDPAFQIKGGERTTWAAHLSRQRAELAQLPLPLPAIPPVQ